MFNVEFDAGELKRTAAFPFTRQKKNKKHIFPNFKQKTQLRDKIKFSTLQHFVTRKHNLQAVVVVAAASVTRKQEANFFSQEALGIHGKAQKIENHS